MAAKRKKSSKKNAPFFLKIALVIILIIFAVSQKDVISDTAQNVFLNDDKDSSLIKAGAFNIQVFGTTKAENSDVMNIISKIIRQYDIIAIQEIRDSSGTALPQLINLVNSDGSMYSYFVSERLGRTSSKEQYAYIYNTKTIDPISDPFTYPEPENTDPFHREPFIGSFKSSEGLFNATFVVIHTDPDEAKEEIDGLYQVAEYAKNVLPVDETVVIMGDYNADGRYFDENTYTPMKSKGYVWVIDNILDTTTGTTDCTYDRIVITGGNDFYTGDAGVHRFDTEYSLTDDFTKLVSDHYPVYAMFSKGMQDKTFDLFEIPKTAGDAIFGSDNESVLDESKNTANNSPDEDNFSNFNTGINIEVTSIDVISNEVEIKNSGQETVDIEGFVISSSKTKNSYVFPKNSYIQSRDTIKLISGVKTDKEGVFCWESINDVWDNSGDAAILYNTRGDVVDSIIS